MARCYSAGMAKCHPVPVLSSAIPRLLLLGDARNDAGLERAIARLPRGSGFVFRHYHLPPAARRERFRALARLCRSRGIAVIAARPQPGWRIDGIYAAPADLGGTGLRLATAHSLRELREAAAARADAVLLSPVFATRSHPGGKALGPVRFLLLARQSSLPVLALGGMTPRRAARLPVHGWAAIDGIT
ncbi:thiamine phosphate synthase [Novosphingobium sp. KCTC 2891]|uniref:thiamine phosphate synthase n=1 Tax=Novosphingobium sp. KCTC 2891 TaxID=2989730 RepID=UPI0022224B85|nr:thiamine phosphate synthase [Novosphingobium sp. KCTC 2891]MCW1382064.1 thiamine phosphate synthase [Novosphingobium sp. KCTC 2891]